MSGVLLAIETSQRVGGVAVRDRAGVDHAESLRTSNRHDDDLLAAVDRLYTRLQLAPSDTDAIGVSTGPGGFTGLRIAIATAKMLSATLGAQLIAVPTALVVAESWAGPGPIIVALACKQQTVWVTRLRRSAGGWAMEQDGRLAEIDSIRFTEADVLLGDRYLPEALRERCHEVGVAVVEPIFDPAACLAVAGRLLADGLATEPLAMAPLYARPPGATAPRDRDRYRT
jgi:tRNA threonylcarbamoyladenosine biosynthesis protein TsaB